jgi:Leucine-rich repeat (LRR) protein
MKIYYKLQIDGKKFLINNFIDIPENVYEIDCSCNQLTYLPKWNNFQNLEKIICSKNFLTYLPEWNNLQSLNYIYCSVIT